MNSMTDYISSVQTLVDMWIWISEMNVLPFPSPLSLGSAEIPDLIHCFHNNILIYLVLFCPFVVITFTV